MDRPFLYNIGLQKLAEEVKGQERIHLGIRPFGFHAGNLVSLYVYPYLFCEFVEKLGKPVNFTLFYSINDYEQDELDGPDYIKYPFNIFPKNTTIGYLSDPKGCHTLTIDHWTPIIQESIKNLQKRFPDINIFFVKNSELKSDLKFKEILTSTLRNPLEQADIYRRFTDKEILSEPVRYAGVVCPICKHTNGTTRANRVNGNYILWNCNKCGVTLNQSYESYDYWFYHKPLFTARMSILNIDITFSGDDHFTEGDFLIRKEFVRRFCPEVNVPKMFFAPLVLTQNGERMSKTKKNIRFGDPKKLIDLCRNLNEKSLILSDDLSIEIIDEKEYLNFF